jgi:hypothetical protein
MPTLPEPQIVVYGLYSLSDPNKRIRYVGQTAFGASTRLRYHLKAHTKKVAGRYPVTQWVKKHGAEDVGIVVLESFEDDARLDAAEVRWIEELGTHVSRGGLNVTLGGGGLRGHTYTRDSGRGELNPNSKLTGDQVRVIKEKIWDGIPYQEIAEQYPINNRTVSEIARGNIWKHIPFPEDRPRRAGKTDARKRL